MRKTIWTGTCVVIVGIAAAVATAQTSSPQQTSSPPQSTPPTANSIVVTGCLKAAPATSAQSSVPTGVTGAAGATGTTGTAGTTGAAGAAAAAAAASAAAAQNFVLTNATIGSADASAAGSTAAPPPPAAPPAASANAPTQTYRLIANAASLSPHVGKKLELTGTLEEPNSSPSTASSASTAADSKVPALRVQSGKIVAASCSE